MCGENLYFNDLDNRKTDYLNNSAYVNMYDLKCTQLSLSIDNRVFNSYVSYINDIICPEIRYTIPNDVNTNKKILFFISFPKIPFDCTFGSEIIRGQMNQSEIDKLCDQIRLTSQTYPTSTIIVFSTIFKHSIDNQNTLFECLFNLGLHNVHISVDFNMDSLNSNDFLAVVSNNTSLLCEHCNSVDIPIILASTHKCESICDRFLMKCFNLINSPNLLVNKPLDLTIIPIQDYGKLRFNIADIFDAKLHKYEENKRFLWREIPRKVKSKLSKLHLFNDAIIFKDVFQNDINKDFITLTNDIQDDHSIVVTMNKFDAFHKERRKNKHTLLPWMCFDFDPVHPKESQKLFRFYTDSFTTRKNIYDFTSVDSLLKKFNFSSFSSCSFNPNGCILICLDNCFGPHYTNKEHWIQEWKHIIIKLITYFPKNKIILKPYSSYIPGIKNTIIREFLSKYHQIQYEESYNIDLLEYLKNNDNILFCVKRQGSQFLQAYLNGKIFLSGLQELDLIEKPDALFVGEYEFTLNHVCDENPLSKLESIQHFYNENVLENLKKMTANFVAIEDIENGYFIQKLISLY